VLRFPAGGGVSKGTQSLILFVLVAAVAAGLLFWRKQLLSLLPVPVAQLAAPASAPVAAEPAIKHPIEQPASPLAAGEVARALIELLGRHDVAQFLRIDDFPRRVVASIDSLGTAHTSAALWPLHPALGRFKAAQERGDGIVIAAANARRYEYIVRVIEHVDVHSAVDLYVRMYPLLQRSYEELGYPKRYFNDRVIEVIDLLLATPDEERPLKLHLTEVRGALRSEKPWVRYEYADPALQSLSSGQKILLRAGPANARRLKAKLVQYRAEILRRTPGR
jgi:hypothetical protein